MTGNSPLFARRVTKRFQQRCPQGPTRRFTTLRWFHADAFDASADYLGRTVEIAADALTGPQMAEVFTRAAGRPVRFHSQPTDQLRAHSEEMAAMFDWFNTVGFRADPAALRAHHPNLTTLATWVHDHWSAPVEPTQPS
ncbi:hypothetical protein OHB13_30820 [Streptomyces sp. NBC_00440]|uniref:NmrA family NAD(P)-binding protein n=1 Tax=unclassified Streptomyces TaxID=2593676 RepID=UPI002E22EAFC|nr:hypothetical protein OG221_06650 [Streptomyces sp. NBC_00932]